MDGRERDYSRRTFRQQVLFIAFTLLSPIYSWPAQDLCRQIHTQLICVCLLEHIIHPVLAQSGLDDARNIKPMLIILAYNYCHVQIFYYPVELRGREINSSYKGAAAKRRRPRNIRRLCGAQTNLMDF